MPTIQVREVPDDVHRTFRRRAADAGMSLQEFLLSELTDSARTSTPAEVVAEVNQQLARHTAEGFSPHSSAELIRSDRDKR